jgi:hypothetical protein
MRPLRWSVSASLAIAALALSGCVDAAGPAATSGPAAPATASAAPTDESSPPEPEASTLVIAGSAVRSVDDSGATVAEVPYSAEPPEAIAFFTDLFAVDPVLSTRPGDQACTLDVNVATWDPGFTVAYDEAVVPEGQRFLVHAVAPEVSGIAIETPSGVTIGDPVQVLQDAIPVGERNATLDSEGKAYDFVHYDVAVGEWVSPDSPEFAQALYWGALARGVDGAVDLLAAPATYIDLC